MPVRERESDDKPPIIELNDILPNEPPVPRDMSGALSVGADGCGVEVVRSRPLEKSCVGPASTTCGTVSEKMDDLRLGFEGRSVGVGSKVVARGKAFDFCGVEAVAKVDICAGALS